MSDNELKQSIQSTLCWRELSVPSIALSWIRFPFLGSGDGEEAMQESFTEGAGGSYFYFTRNKKYMFKTLTPSGLWQQLTCLLMASVYEPHLVAVLNAMQ